MIGAFNCRDPLTPRVFKMVLFRKSLERKSLDKGMRSQAESEKHGWKVERVAKLIGKIARAGRPRFRYTPGPFVERISPMVRRLIPDRLYLRIIAGFYGL